MPFVAWDNDMPSCNLCKSKYTQLVTHISWDIEDFFWYKFTVRLHGQFQLHVPVIGWDDDMPSVATGHATRAR